MIRYYLSLFFVVLTSGFISAQNLIPNPSFETFNACPIGPSQIYEAFPWTQPTDSGTSDYFNVCNFSFIPGFAPPVGVPLNLLGNQAARTGVAYAGFFATEGIAGFGDNGYREYVQAPLTSPLVPGKQYCFKMYVSRADNCTAASDGTSALFTTTPIQQAEGPMIANPQIFVTTPMTDAVNWVEVAGIFTADSAYAYITIGNFKGQNQNTTTGAPSAGFPPLPGSYYYVDDVSLVEVTGGSQGSVSGDTLVCVGQQAVLTASGGLSYLWNTGDTTASVTVSPTDTTVYWVLVDNGCSRDSLSITVNTDNCVVVPGVIQANLTALPDSICPGDCTVLVAEGINCDGPCFYTWQGIQAQGDSAFVCLNEPGSYSVIISDSAGSVTDTAYVTVGIKKCPSIVPNIITNNQDGLNDSFFIQNLIPNTKVMIFNRWGNLMYRSDNYQNDWKPTHVSPGCYFYIVDIPDQTTQKGVLYIITP